MGHKPHDTPELKLERALSEIARLTAERDAARSLFAVMSRACGNWREWPGQAVTDHDHPDWQAATRAIIERDALREALEEAAAWIKELDGGDMSTETGWKSQDLLDVWLKALTALGQHQQAERKD